MKSTQTLYGVFEQDSGELVYVEGEPLTGRNRYQLEQDIQAQGQEDSWEVQPLN